MENPIYKIAWNYFKKITWIIYINFSKNFHEYIRTENTGYKIARNYSKNYLICWFVLNVKFFNLKIFSKNFRGYIRKENPSYKIAWN